MTIKHLRLATIISLILILFLNIIGLYNANLMFYGFFILIAIFSFIFSNKLGIGKLMLYTSLFVIIHLAIRHSIDFVFNYETVGENSKVIVTWIKVISGTITYITAQIIALAIGLGYTLWNRKISIIL